MSARSQLRFTRSDRDDETGVAQIYKHSDGYPFAVIHLLVELADLLHATETLRGPNYAAAQFLFLDTCSVLPLYLPAAAELCEESRTMDVSTPARPSSTTRWPSSTSPCSCWATSSRI